MINIKVQSLEDQNIILDDISISEHLEEAIAKHKIKKKRISQYKNIKWLTMTEIDNYLTKNTINKSKLSNRTLKNGIH